MYYTHLSRLLRISSPTPIPASSPGEKAEHLGVHGTVPSIRGSSGVGASDSQAENPPSPPKAPPSVKIEQLAVPPSSPPPLPQPRPAGDEQSPIATPPLCTFPSARSVSRDLVMGMVGKKMLLPSLRPCRNISRVSWLWLENDFTVKRTRARWCSGNCRAEFGVYTPWILSGEVCILGTSIRCALQGTRHRAVGGFVRGEISPTFHLDVR